MEIMNSKRDKSWIIGDTILDCISAKEADIQAIAVTCGYGKVEDLKEHTDIIVADAYEAVEYIKKYK